jgi:hypothetical protein
MTPLAGDDDREAVRRGGDGAAPQRDRPDRGLVVEVDGEGRGGIDPVEGPVRQHGRRALEELLGRLECEDHRPREGRALARPDLRRREDDGGVGVVPARVHDAGRARPPGHGHGFLERQRVDLAPDQDRRAGAAPRQPPRDPGLAETGPHGVSELGEASRDQARGAHLLEAELRMLVKVPAQRAQALAHGRYRRRDRGHELGPHGSHYWMRAV